MACIAKHGVFAHARCGQGKARPIPHATKGSYRAATFAIGKTAPHLGAGTIRGQVIHIDAFLAEQGQHILCGTDQFGDGAILQRVPQGAKAGTILGVFGKLQRANEVSNRQRRAQIFGRGAKRQCRFFIAKRGARGGKGGFAIGRCHRQRRITARGKAGKCRFGLFLAGRDLIQLLFQGRFCRSST